jgi:3-oxoadipate enol-lactonase
MSQDTTAGASAHIELRGVDFAYTDIGRGPLVLDAHGLTSSRANNRRMELPDFSSVTAAGRRLISFDARGHGETSGTRDPEDYTWAALARDLLAFAEHFSPDSPVSAIGSSMGTGTIINAAAGQPDRFDRLVLTAPPTAWETRAAQADMYRIMADTVEKTDPETLATLMSQAPIPPIFADVPGFPPTPDIKPALQPTVFRGAGLSDLPPLESLTALTQPTLILAWTGDPGHPVSTAEKLASTLPNAELHVSDSHADLLTWGERAAAFLSR